MKTIYNAHCYTFLKYANWWIKNTWYCCLKTDAKNIEVAVWHLFQKQLLWVEILLRHHWSHLLCAIQMSTGPLSVSTTTFFPYYNLWLQLEKWLKINAVTINPECLSYSVLTDKNYEFCVAACFWGVERLCKFILNFSIDTSMLLHMCMEWYFIVWCVLT